MRLYRYMQQRLLLAHSKQDDKPIAEVEGLLTNLSEAWEKVADEHALSVCGHEGELIQEPVRDPESEEMFVYGSYFHEAAAASVLGEAYSF